MLEPVSVEVLELVQWRGSMLPAPELLRLVRKCSLDFDSADCFVGANSAGPRRVQIEAERSALGRLGVAARVEFARREFVVEGRKLCAQAHCSATS